MTADQLAAALLAIRGYMELRGYPPSIRELRDELRDELGVASTSTVYEWLRALEFKGYIRRVHGQPRAIQVID